jgi:hypothetical protein
MSRHVLRDDAYFEVIVGWDPPLETLFLQVYDKSVDEDYGPLVWKGLNERIEDLSRLRTLVQEWAPMSDRMVARLEAEMAE